MVRKKKPEVLKTIVTRSSRLSALEDSATTSNTPEEISNIKAELHSNDGSQTSCSFNASDNDSSSFSSSVKSLLYNQNGKNRLQIVDDAVYNRTEQKLDVNGSDENTSAQHGSQDEADKLSLSDVKSSCDSSIDSSESSNFIGFKDYSFSNGTESCEDSVSISENVTVESDIRPRKRHVNLNNLNEIVNNNCDIVNKQAVRCFEEKLQNGSLQQEQYQNSELYHDENGEVELITVFEIVDDHGMESASHRDKFEVASEIEMCRDRDSSSDQASSEICLEVAKAMSVQQINGIIYTEDVVDSPRLSLDLINNLNDISNLKISSNDHSNCVNSNYMDCADLSNVPLPTKSNDSSIFENGLGHPEPSDTPNSSISDDSTGLTKSQIEVGDKSQGATDSSSSSSINVIRRSSRIKTISVMKQRSKGHGLVKSTHKKLFQMNSKDKLDDSSNDSYSKYENSASGSANSQEGFTIPSSSDEKPVKVKSRWRRSSEMEMSYGSPITPPTASPTLYSKQNISEMSSEKYTAKIGEITVTFADDAAEIDKDVEEKLKNFQLLMENDYLCEKTISKEARRMTCDCFLTKEEIKRGEFGCGEDCLNRLLMIECNSRCPVGDRCTNRRFQKNEYIQLEVVRTEKKGFGIQSVGHIPPGEFLMEYIGEVLNFDQFYKRAAEYSADNNKHHYFMALKSDTIIDATLKGNISRFINHSCEPNAETQKWTVNGELRVGFFTKRDVRRGEEITFDYQFQRYGKIAQKCYCQARNCRGWIGAEPDSDDDESDLEDEDEEEIEKTENASQSSGSMKDKYISASEKKNNLDHHGRRKDDNRKDSSQAVGRKQFRTRSREKPRKSNWNIGTDLLQDTDDVEKEIASLSRTGVINQAHTLLLSRAALRAPSRTARAALLCLLRGAALPCRRLFLDYRGLRLLAPWCSEEDMQFRLELLQTLEILPIPNKTMLRDCRLISTIERWIQEYSILSEIYSPVGSPVLVDEATGLAIETKSVNKMDAALEEIRRTMRKDISDERIKMKTKIIELSQQLLERWSVLKDVFRIPKKERLLQMKEHEREANKSSDQQAKRSFRPPSLPSHQITVSPSSFNEESQRHTSRHSDRRLDRRPERRHGDRGLLPHPSPSHQDDKRRTHVSKEERRRAFAAAAEEADRMQCHAPSEPSPSSLPLLSGPSGPPMWQPPGPFWPPNDAFGLNGFPMGMPMPGPDWIPPGMPMLGPGMPPGFPSAMPDFSGFGFCQPPFPMPPGFMMPNAPPGPPLTLQMLPPLGPLPPALLMAGHPPQTTPNSVECGDPAKPPEPPPLPAQLEQPPILPSGWRSVVDIQGRVYYYHVRERVPQWTPPSPPPPVKAESGDEESSNDDEESDTSSPVIRKPQTHVIEGVDGIYEVIDTKESLRDNGILLNKTHKKQRKRRLGLVTELIISPRTEEDKLANKMEVKRYKETKEKLKKRKEKLVYAQAKTTLSAESRMYLKALAQRHRKKYKEMKERHKRSKEPLEEMEEEAEDLNDDSPEVSSPVAPLPSPPMASPPPPDSDTVRRIKELFRSSMARVMVQHLNPYRRHDCTSGRITNTDDFKHLARKLTHFVMLKELKHCRSVEELECNDSVKQKAREFVRKYMAKFGATYQRPDDEIE